MKTYPSLLWSLLAVLLLTAATHARADNVAAYRQAVTNELALVGYYPVDGDTAPTLTDRKLPAQNGTNAPSASFVTGAGVVGTHALQGAATLGVVPEYQFSNGVGTVEAILYQTNTSAYNPCFFSVRSATQTRYSLHASGGATNKLYFWNGTNVAAFTTPMNLLTQRVQVAFVFSNNTVTAYCNGASLGTSNLALGAAGQPCQIGAANPANGEPWLGRIDELAIYTNALSAQTLAQHAAILYATSFTNIPIAGLPGVWYARDRGAAWGDFDNDGRLDFLLTGSTNDSSSGFISQLWRNTGSGFTHFPVAGLPAVRDGSVAWGDYDNDGRMDFLLTGATNGVTGQRVSQLWRNTGSGFTNVPIPGLPGVSGGSVAWGDYDNDGRLDFLLTGVAVSGRISQLWRNTGSGFTLVPVAGLTGVGLSSVAWADYDHDGRLDFLLTGDTGGSIGISQLWRNTGSGFTLVPVTGLPGVYNSSVAWGDYDNDGRLDFLLTGNTNANAGVSQLWRNTGSGFTNVPVPGLAQVYGGSVAWGDYDNDGRLDFLLTGPSTSGQISQLWRNTGSGFSNVTSQIAVALPQVHSGSVAWADLDNDGRLDFLLTGNSASGNVSQLWRNSGTAPNTPPLAPTGLSTQTNGPNSVTLRWNPALDAQTPTNGLSYNLVLGSSANVVDLASPLADLANGFRRVARLGPVSGGTNATPSYTFTNLPYAAQYFWSVQAIDTAFAGGPFAPAKTFNLDVAPTMACPSNLVTNVANGPDSVAVSWTVAATGNPAPVVTCVPASGSLFSVGSTPVTCTATNLVGTNTCTFLVTVCAANLVVTSANNSGPGSLRVAISNACPGGIITFDPALRGQTIVLTSGELVIRTNLSILGPGATNLAIDGGGASSTSSRIFFIDTNVVCTIAGLTLTNGSGYGRRSGGQATGGGLYNEGILTIESCAVTGNKAAYTAGGIYNVGTLTIRNSALTRNSSPGAAFVGGNGGGINNQGVLTIENSTLSDNSAFRGSGIYNARILAIRNSTISGNQGSGIVNDGNPSLSLTNTIVAGNSAGDIFSSFTLVSNGRNFIGTTNGISNAQALTDRTFANTGTTLGQLLATNALGQPLLANNGGPTLTIALVPGSPAINSGLNVDAPGLEFDQRGPGFPRLVGGAVDIGAYEMQATAPVLAECPANVVTTVANGTDTRAVSWTAPTAAGLPTPVVTCVPASGSLFGVGSTLVTCTATNLAGTNTCTFLVTVCATNIVVANAGDSGPGSLRTAISNACPGGTITFAPALNGQTIVLTSGELVIRTNLSILGPGATNLTISGNNSSRVFTINPGVTNLIAGLTITNGYGVGAFSSGNGGGIYNQGSLTVSNCTLSGNSANSSGGGINNDATLTVQNSTISGNWAKNGSGGGIANAATLRVQNSTVSTNLAPVFGGGIRNDGTLALQNSTLSGNWAVNSGGGISAAGIELLTNCIVAGNVTTVGRNTPNDIGGSVDSAAFNLIGSAGSSGGITHGVNGNIVGNAGSGTLAITSILDTNLDFNGGPTRTHALLPGSPAFNAGTNVAGLPDYDQRGPGFMRLVGSAVDIGAFELGCGDQGGPPYFGDVDADGLTFLDDFATLRGNFGMTGVGRAGGDLNGDSAVNSADYLALRNNFGHAAAQCYPNFTPPAGIPYAGFSNGLSLRLLFDGTVEIVNLGADPVAISGYSLYATNGVLDPNLWRSLNALTATNPAYVTGNLGAGAASFVTANPTSRLLSELNLSGVAAFPPGFALSLGQPDLGGLEVTNDVRFFYVQDGVVREGAVNRTPVAIPDLDATIIRANGLCEGDIIAAHLNFQSRDFDGDRLTFGLTPPGPYPLGGTNVLFWAIDDKGASNAVSIELFVRDGTAPSFTNRPFSDIVAALPPGSNTVQVFYEIGAEDECTPVSIECNWPSGSYFPVGESLVTCTARDGGGNTEETRFAVVVSQPEFSVATLGLPPVSFGAAAWGDYDNDGWLDLVLTGNSTNGTITQIWRNQGDNTFSNINAGLPGLNVSAAAWGDYNNDGRLDLAIAGNTGSSRVTQIWRNTGTGFVNLNAGITGVDDGALAWGDYDNDGRIDLLLTGVNGPRVAQVWRNTGTGFVNINANLPGVSTGGAAWGDFDNDGRLDILLSGFDSGGGRKSVLWRNTGSGFAEVDSALPGVTASSVAWADYDNDGWLDLAIAGNAGNQSIAQVWRNTGGSFSNINANLPGVAECSVAWGDYDNDGKPDLLITGTQRTGGPLTQIWRNNETNFVSTPSGLAGVRIGKGAWADYNNDGRLDVVLMGQTQSGPVTQIWRNNTPGVINSVPATPTGLHANPTATGVDLRWTAASDAETPTPGLSYNLAIGASAGGMGLLSPEANLTDGWRRLPALGNAQLGTNAMLELPPGTYFWAVQAVDSAWVGGPFAEGGRFVVGTTVELRITGYERQSASEFWLSFTGGAGAVYRVEWSENLTTWNELSAATEAAPGVFEYLDTSASPERRFYRVTKP